MSWCLVAGGAVAGLLALVTLARLAFYRRILSRAHFEELARGLVGIWSQPAGAEGPPSFLTTAGVGVVYTRTATATGDEEHHLSLSHRGAPFAVGAGLLFVAFLCRLLGVPPERVRCFRTQTGVLHATFTVAREDTPRWSAPPAIPAGPELDERIAQARAARQTLLARYTHERIGAPPRGPSPS